MLVMFKKDNTECNILISIFYLSFVLLFKFDKVLHLIAFAIMNNLLLYYKA